MMLHCPDCNHPIKGQEIFCENCGYPLDSAPKPDLPTMTPSTGPSPGICSACGYENIPGETFCQNCYVQLPPVASSPPPPPTPVQFPGQDYLQPAIEAEKKQVIKPTKCSECGYQISHVDKFCPNCGLDLSTLVGVKGSADISEKSPYQLDKTPEPQALDDLHVPPMLGPCPSCGQINELGSKFCQVCGLELHAEIQAEKQASLSMQDIGQGALIQKESIQKHEEPGHPILCPTCGHEKTDFTDKFCAICGQFIETLTEEAIQKYETAPFDLDAVSDEETFIPSVGEEIRGKLLIRISNTEIPLPAGKNELIIGRIDPEQGLYPDVDLTPFGGDRAGVSRNHARLLMKESQLFIEDLNSLNYTFVNKQRLEVDQLYSVKDGDEIRFGGVVVYYSEI